MNPFRNTHRVNIELSNRCPYTVFHKKCPTSLAKKIEILSAEIVYGIFRDLCAYDYDRELTFHNYSEPLADPRLFEFIRLANKLLPKVLIFIWTNGFYLNQNILSELEQAGVRRIFVSAYSEFEFERLSNLKADSDYILQKQYLLDEVLKIYDAPEIDCHDSCFSPLGDIIIHSDGKVGLCCVDWRKEHTFGNLYDELESLANIVENSEMRTVYNRLRTGDRFLPICRRCNRISCGAAFQGG